MPLGSVLPVNVTEPSDSEALQVRVCAICVLNESGAHHPKKKKKLRKTLNLLLDICCLSEPSHAN